LSGGEEGQMVVAHLLFGIFFGMFAAAASLLIGFSFWPIFGFYVLGGVAGISLSVGLTLVRQLNRTLEVLMD
jgi:hypothetical protein